ncbi:MAG: hypothetical protein KAR11_02050 [Phycisphaerae bacterium]|nr:hypothetical protein [Phycisphaerae bacterium]
MILDNLGAHKRQAAIDAIEYAKPAAYKTMRRLRERGMWEDVGMAVIRKKCERKFVNVRQVEI